jgi:ring-1,2-phenylacetyl-CoA epoxidase subunit PaaB
VEEIPGPVGDFLVFAKLEGRGTLTHVGKVRAESKAEALREGARAAGAQAALVLWVIPAVQVTASEADQVAPLFAPALEKPFRHQSFYHIHTALRRLRREAGR